MSKLVVFPSDPIKAYIDKGADYNYLDQYYNPGGFFDEVISISPWGDTNDEVISKIRYIKSSPYKFKTIIKQIKPDIVRAYGGYYCSDWISFNKIKGIPTLVSVHDTKPELIHSSLQYADGIICMSQAVKDAVLKLVPNVTNNIWVMPNRVDTNLFSKKCDSEKFDSFNKRFNGKYHIIHVGRKTKQKNLDTVIKSLKYLSDDYVAIFIGKGDIKDYVELAKNKGVFERCYFIDSIKKTELPYWYSWCDCMCTPSRWEGFGFVFIEAAACEAAIVTSDIGPMNEYLENNKNAILVKDYENPMSIANAIKRCIENKEDIVKMKTNARKVGLKFKKESIDEQEIEIYKYMIKVKPNNINNNELKRQLILNDMKNSIDKYKYGIKRWLYKNIFLGEK